VISAPRSRTCVAAQIILTTAMLTAQSGAPSAGLDVSAFDRGVRPQDNLFMHVNGRWLAAKVMPSDAVNYGTFIELSDRAELEVRAIVEEITAQPKRAAGSPTQQIADLYASIMDEKRLDALGAAPIQPELARIDAIATSRDLAAEAGYLSAIAAGGPFAGEVGEDVRVPGSLVVRISPGGTLLPDRKDYLDPDPKFEAIRRQYVDYLVRIFRLVGRARPDVDAAHVVELETAIARLQWDQNESRDPSNSNGRFTLAELSKGMPGFDWQAWAKPQGIDHAAYLVLARPSFFKEFAALVPRVPLDAWKAWLAARFITASSIYLSNALGDARFDFFGRILTGQELPRTRWKRGVSLVNSYLGDAVGRLYVARRFSPTAKRRAERLAAQVLTAWRQAIAESEWLSAPAKREATAKLSRLSMKLAYPENWREYHGLTIKPDDLVGNVRRAQKFENDYRMRHIAGDRQSNPYWLITPQTVNAYYNPALNEMVVPAALLQPPLFDADGDDAINFGGIGAVIGHEISHGFDDRGRFYDATGTVRDWWTPRDVQEFERRSQLVVDQFGGYAPAEGLRVNGSLTRSENLGDLAGLAVAYRAYRISLHGRDAPILDGLTGDQRFFLAWARAWRGAIRPEYLRQWLLTIPYAPPEYRANGTVVNIEGFYEAFGVKPGDRLYREPGARVTIW